MPANPGASPVRKRVWKAGRILVLVGALGVTYGVFFLASMRVASRAREVTVPDLRGQSVSGAYEALTAVGLSLRVDEARRSDPAIPADHVLAQDPEAGSVLRRQRSVRVRLSDGQRDPAVPAVVGSPERAAEAALAADRIAVGLRAEIRSPDYSPGIVVAQDPPAQQRAASVSLLVNRRDDTETFVMPDLIGTLADRTVALLRAQNFRVSVAAEVPYPGLPVGIVVRQTPLAGHRVTSVQAITLEVTK